jgi:threonine dehydrogenase-like Zn-dependent dehydrogenase
MRLRVTHLLVVDAAPDRPADGLAVELAGTPAGARRLFVPGWLPCGECGPCRRGLVAACPRGHAPFAGLTAPPAAPLELASERFLTPVDVAGDALEDPVAVTAGLAAEVIEAAARAGLGPGQVAVWAGTDARCVLGARWAAARAATSFHLRHPPAPAAAIPLDLGDGPERWRDTIAAALQQAHGAPERRLFLGGRSADEARAALALADPGTTISFLPGAPAVALDTRAHPLSRILTAGASEGRYHPDLVTEALAALRKGEMDLADLVGPSAPLRVVAAGGG